MNRTPLAPIEFLGVGDILSGQDGNKYVVCKKADIPYWEPYTTNVSVVTPSKPIVAPAPVASPSKPIKKVKEVKEKYYWKDNDKKPKYHGNNWTEMQKALKPKVSPNKFPAGYVWTTKFSNISFVVDIGYKGSSTTQSRFWNYMYECPPCLDANDYPFEHKEGRYYVEYDEQGNKFWCDAYGDGVDCPIQPAYKFVEGDFYQHKNGNTYFSRRQQSLCVPCFWKNADDSSSDDSDDE